MEELGPQVYKTCYLSISLSIMNYRNKYLQFLLYYIIIFVILSFCNGKDTYPYHIQVHVVPHSHVDPMWLFTSKEYSQRTRLILEKTILTLLLDEKKTFVWESIFFLDNFLKQQGDKSICDALTPEQKYNSNIWDVFSVTFNCTSFKKSIVHLLKTKQLELVGGGWISYDEALTDFSSGLNDLALGRSWIANTLGIE